MTVPERDVDRVTAWCATRLPESVRDAVRTECEVSEDSVTIVESRVPHQRTPGSGWSRCPVARLQFQGPGPALAAGAALPTAPRGWWTLFWRDRQGTFQPYDFLAPSVRVEDLLAELDRDPVAVFWR